MRSVAWVLLLAAPLLADTVTLKNGKKARGLVVSEAPEVVVNPYNSSVPGMVRGVERFPAGKVSKIVRDLPRPWHQFHARLKAATTPEQCLEVARWCGEEKLREEQALALERALDLDPANAEVRKLLGTRAPRGDRAAQRDLARRYLEATDDAARAEAGAAAARDPDFPWDALVLQRAARSRGQPRGQTKDRPLAMRADKLLPNAVYTLVVPESYDPLTPAPLVVGLHGGGAGGADGKLVVGSGWQAMEFYREECLGRGWICVCPTALVAGWGNRENSDLIDAVLDELLALFNIDENRIYLVGHSMGGGGAWAQGTRLVGRIAAVAPASSFGVQGIAEFQRTLTGLYVYHSDNDPRCSVDGVRPAMDSLVGSDTDFVYTELPGRDHEFPIEVVHDIFEFFDLRRRALGTGKVRPTVRPLSSFERKVSRDEKRYLPPLAGGAAAAEEESLEAVLKELRAGGGLAEQAAGKLEKSADPRVPGRVARILTAPDAPSDVRRYGARVLGALKARDQIKALGKALTQETQMNSLVALLEALGAMEDPAIVEEVVRFLRIRRDFLASRVQEKNALDHSDWETILPTLARASQVLSPYKDKRCATAICENVLAPLFLGNLEVYYDAQNEHPMPPAREVAEAACQALASLQDPSAIPALEKMVAPGPNGAEDRVWRGPVHVMGRWAQDPAIHGHAQQALSVLRSAQ